MEPSATAKPFDLNVIKQQAIQVITKPSEFYRAMPVSGGLQNPLLFAIAISIVTGIIRAIFMITTSFVAAIGVMIMTPIFALIGSFIGGFILWVIWKLMGSSHPYETAYRCGAYATAIIPITTLIVWIPYLGGIVGTAWGMFLLYQASVEVHKIGKEKARLVWGILFVIMALLGLKAEASSRRIQREWSGTLQTYSDQKELTPEDAGRMLGEFMKGLEKAAQQTNSP